MISEFDYTKEATRTESYNKDVLEKRIYQEQSIRLIHACLGIQTESGEVADVVKKSLFYGKGYDTKNGELTHCSTEHIKEELGDLLWYVAIACDVLNVKIEDVMKENIEKLRMRYPDKFTESAAIARADKVDCNE